MESHKRILGILYIVAGSLQIIGLLIVSAFIRTLFPWLASEVEPEAAWILEWIGAFIPMILWFLILFFGIPSVVGGIAMLYKKSWALTLLLILGCFKLFSFPLGTALGIYTIYVYAEDKKSSTVS